MSQMHQLISTSKFINSLIMGDQINCGNVSQSATAPIKLSMSIVAWYWLCQLPLAMLPFCRRKTVQGRISNGNLSRSIPPPYLHVQQAMGPTKSSTQVVVWDWIYQTSLTQLPWCEKNIVW